MRRRAGTPPPFPWQTRLSAYVRASCFLHLHLYWGFESTVACSYDVCQPHSGYPGECPCRWHAEKILQVIGSPGQKGMSQNGLAGMTVTNEGLRIELTES